MRYFSLFLILFFGVIKPGIGQAVKVPNIKDKSTITYSMVHPLHKWDGVSKEVSSVILTDASRSVITQVAVTAKLASFDSKNANRDSHMLEVAEGIKFPNVTFAGNDIQQKDGKLLVKGKLTFHGITRDISFEGVRKDEGKITFISGGFDVKLSDFNIEPPSILGFATEDSFKIKFSMAY